MRKRITILNKALAARNEKKSQLTAALNGKIVTELKMAELLALVEYMAQTQNLVDDAGRLALPHTGQVKESA